MPRRWFSAHLELARTIVPSNAGLSSSGWSSRQPRASASPEPVVSAGLKSANVGQNSIANGATVSVSIPLPIFNKGQAEIARFSAEQERASARLQLLSQQIRAAVEGTVRAYNVRVQARDRYRHELARTGPELVKIATIAYQEGEIGILQLLDAYRTQRQAQLRMVDIQAAVKDAQIA